MIILFIPGILLSKTVRFYFLAAVLVYAVISILYISMPNLNPEGNRRYSLESFSCGGSGYVNGKSVDNLVHWVNIICQSKILEVNDKEVYSLPNFLGEIFGGEFPLWVTRLPLFLTALFAFLGFYFFRQPSALERDEMAFYICILGLLCHYLSYNRVWEYQFSTLQIVSPFLLCTFYLEKKGIGKGLIGFAFLMTLTFFLPTLYFHTSTPAFGELWKIRFIRSLPPAVIFFTLGGLVIVRFFKISKSPLTVS
jgi:hypothetical protein